MIDTLLALFPLFVLAAAVAAVVLAVRLDRRMSRAATSAGPVEMERARPPGQEQTPWELQAIDDQLHLAHSGGPSAVPRYDLTATVNRLLQAAGLDQPGDQLPPNADPAQLAAAISRIEERLGLGPLTTSDVDAHRREAS
ncbi:MAG: hypothetical protein ACFCVK_17655 [Acidimicrobiales bacterium]